MVVHDMRGPAEAIQEGLKQAESNMNSGFNNMFKRTKNFYTDKVILPEDSLLNVNSINPRRNRFDKLSGIIHRSKLRDSKFRSGEEEEMKKEEEKKI